MVAPSIRSGFPVVASSAAAAAPYSVTTASFTASAGDELCAIAICGGLPEVISRNATDTGPGALKWLRRFVTRVDYTTTTTNVAGAQQLAIYTAVVPAGGVTELARFTTLTVANDGGATVTPNSLPARLAVFAVDNTNGVGAVTWKGSMKTGPGGSADITTGLAATQTIKPMGTDSLVIGGGWFVDGSAPTAASGCTEVVAPGADGMPMWTRVANGIGVDLEVGSSVTDSTLWALGLIEYLPTTTAKPSRKLFVFGDSGAEATNSARPTPVVVQDELAPAWELFNYGVWFAHTDQTLTRWTADSPNFPPMHAAIVQVGFNDIVDLGGGTTWPAGSATNLSSLYTAIRALRVPMACYTGIGPLATPAVAPAGYYDFRDFVRNTAPPGSHFYSLDLVTDPGSGYLAMIPANLSSDGGHLSAAGCTIYGENIAAFVETLVVPAVERPVNFYRRKRRSATDERTPGGLFGIPAAGSPAGLFDSFMVLPLAAGGPVSHDTAGALVAGAAVVSGSALHTFSHATSGALTAGSAQVAGSAVRTLPHATSGALTAGAAQVAGSAVRTLPHATSGALAAGSATIAGTAAQTRAHASSGALVTGSAVVAGSAARTLPHATSGALVAGSATVAGTADHVVAGGTHDTSGALVAGSAQVSGAAVLNLLHTTSGALAASAAAVSSTAAQTRAHASSGALAAGSATVSGTAAQTRAHITSGDLVSGSATVAGTAGQAAGGIHTTSGNLVAGSAQVSGDVTGPAVAGNGFGFEMSSGTQRKRRSMVYVVDDKTKRSSAEDDKPDTQETRRQTFRAARAQAETIIKSAAVEHAAQGVSKAVRYGHVRTSLKPIAGDLGDWNWINLYQRMYDQALTEQIRQEIKAQDEAEEDSIIALLLVSL